MASNCLVYGNIMVRGGAEGIRMNGGKNNVIENNIIVGYNHALSTLSPAGSCYPQMAVANCDFMSGNRYCRNIFYGVRSDLCLYVLYSWTDRVFGQSEHNLFFDSAGVGHTVSIEETGASEKMVPLAEWQEMGYDRHSVIADPLFVDPENDDYRLRPESPASELGFQPIDVEKVGPGDRS